MNKFILLLFIAAFVFHGCKKDDPEPEVVTTLPEVVTTPVSMITVHSARAGGNIISNGNTAISSRGLCYDTTSSPNISGNIVINGSGNGNFTSDLINLNPNTIYFVRAYATNNIGTAYGNEISFMTSIDSVSGLPILTTLTATSITTTTATSGGNITDDGGFPVIAKGICFNTSPNPTLANFIVSSGSGTGMYFSDLTNLLPNTTYYVRAYAVNNTGTAYGNEISFTTQIPIPLSLILVDSIRLLDTGPTTMAILPPDTKLEVTVTSDFTTISIGGSGRTLYAQDNTAAIQIRFNSIHSFDVQRAHQ